MTARGLLETADELPAAFDPVRAEIEAAAGGRVGAVPVLGGDVGAVVVDTLQATNNAEADGKPRPTAAIRCRNTWRAICTALCLRPTHCNYSVGHAHCST